jgi:cytochrome P450
MTDATFPAHVPPHLVRDIKWYGLEDPAGDPNAALGRLHGGLDVFFIPKNARNPYGTWVLTRFEDIQHALSDTEHFTSNHISGFNILSGVEQLLIPVELDPPDHGKYRAFLNPNFSHAKMLAYRDVMRSGVDRVIDEIIDQGEADVVPCAFRMMAAIWCAVMGAPYESSARYIGFLFDMIHQYDPAARLACARDMLAAMRELYELNKGADGQGLISRFIHAQINGRAPSESECAGFILFMFLAGMDTMGSTTVWVLRHLALHPRQRQDLIDHPDRRSVFIEEALRRYATVSTNRFVKKDVRIRDVLLKAGDNVLLSMPMACMDPAKFECPEQMRVDRKERHMAFGAGAHFCVGAALVRLQLPIMLDCWLARIPHFSIRPNAQVVAHFGDVLGLDTLPLVWERQS